MADYRIFVEKYPEFQVEARSLQNELNANLGLSLHGLRLLSVYDLFGFTPELLEKCRYGVFGEVVTDSVTDDCDLNGCRSLAVEFLPGQFDQRAASAVDCVHLIDPAAEVRIRSSRLLVFDPETTAEEVAKVEKYYVNAVESRVKDLSLLSDAESAEVKPVPVLEGLTQLADDELEPFCKRYGLAMNADDLREVVRYFAAEGRDPYETELRILDTYWSDHCRHTTFTTELTGVTVDESFIKEDVENSLALYLKMRRELNREHKSLCLMDMATIGARYLRKCGLLDDLEVSEENNACSIFVDADVDGKTERWLLQFKNETHNHPTEIEPFGGASTCLGGAIRDPLSGRSYVYQAMRVTGAGDIYKPVAETLEGKLPQRVISLKAAAGYSSYGNQMGLATTHVREIYHPDYVAKRLEVGAVVGAVKADKVRRESPVAGDVILLLGGRTGRDGIGGATGSSKEHTAQSLTECSSEVQKGNAPEERKLARLFRRGDVTRMIKKSNDFGAGGVSVAIGELADGLDIYLDRVPVKYNGLNATELAISESQERMAVVIEAKDEESFRRCCAEENIEVTHVADVTDTARLRMFWHGDKMVDITREFIDSAGAKHYAEARVAAVEHKNPFVREVEGETLEEKMCRRLAEYNVVSQRGLIEMFDSTVGASTVLMPFGGRTQRTETQVSVQKLPVDGYTDTASIMAFGYNPEVSSWSPYHGAAYSVVEACAKVVAAGARYDRMRFSYQEYFERMTREAHSWGKPLSALLGALKMQVAMGLPSIGGKDSMSGTFRDINVPPMLMAFGVTTVDARKVISPEFKAAGHNLYIIRHTPLDNEMPDTEALKRNFTFVSDAVADGRIVAAYALGFGGAAEALAKMAFGNEVGAEVTIDEAKLFDLSYGSILVEAAGELDFAAAEHIGCTAADTALTINGVRMELETLYKANSERYTAVYPDRSTPMHTAMIECAAPEKTFEYQGDAVETPHVYIPVFPGTNCDYDTAAAFRRAGCTVELEPFRNLAASDVNESIERMAEGIGRSHILALSGGFSAGDEPDGSGKFISSVLCNERIVKAIKALTARGGLVLGICNGFQALIKSGLLPDGADGLGKARRESPTLFRNDINRHISQIVTTRVASAASPWLSGFSVGDLHSIAVSHGEGKFVVREDVARRLFENGQVAFQYADADGRPTMQSPWNPNGSYYAIEGVVSADGLILGKMGHTERYDENLFKNIAGEKRQSIFENAVRYFRKRQ